MLANISCAQSSGSTALSHSLDRHPDIACGAELFLFCHRLLHTDYRQFRTRARLTRLIGLSNLPFSTNRSLFRHLRDFGLTKSQFWGWAREADSLPDLARRMHDHVRHLSGKQNWVEKTPWNIFAIPSFLESFPEARVIHLVRDPRDVILSLCRRSRDKDPLRAAQHWFTAVAAAQSSRNHDRVLEVRYEDLCHDSDRELARICAFLGVNFDPAYFRDDTHASRGLHRWSGYTAWTSRPDAGFSEVSVGRYRTASIDWSPFSALRLTGPFAAAVGTRPWTLPDLARSYGYELADAGQDGEFIPLHLPRPLDPLRRTLDSWTGRPGYFPQLEQRR